MTDTAPARPPRLDDLLLTSDERGRVMLGCPDARPGTEDWADEQPVETLGEALTAGHRHLDQHHPAPLRPAAPGDDMRALLVAGGTYTGRLSVQAAVHLLTFTDLPAWRGFTDLVHVEEVDDLALSKTYTAAFVQDWPGLAELRSAHISNSTCRLLALAASLAVGAPVDLRDTLPGFGHAGKRRVLEAVAIATDAAGLYAITPTPELVELEAFHRDLQGGTR